MKGLNEIGDTPHELRIKALRLDVQWHEKEQSRLKRRNMELESLVQILRDERKAMTTEAETLAATAEALRDENERLLVERDELLAELGR